MAQLWFSRPVPELTVASRVLDEGMGCFVAMSLDAPADSKTTYYYLNDYSKWREALPDEDSISTERAVRTIPGWLQICRALSSDSIVWGALRDYADVFRYVHPPADTLAALLNKWADPVYLPTIDEAAWLLDSLDMIISDATFKRTDQGYSVSCEILQNGPIDLPIEIGYVDDHKDTLYTAIMVHAHPTADDITTVDYLSDRPLFAVVLDPNHRLPDFNRTNNYRFAHLSRFRYEWPAILFPAYDR